MVKKQSAVIEHCDATALYANHLGITKFSTDSDSRYEIVIQSMRSMYCLAEDSVSVLLRHSLESRSQGRLRNLPTTPDGCEEFIVSTQGSLEARSLGKLALVLED